MDAAMTRKPVPKDDAQLTIGCETCDWSKPVKVPPTAEVMAWKAMLEANRCQCGKHFTVTMRVPSGP